MKQTFASGIWHGFKLKFKHYPYRPNLLKDRRLTPDFVNGLFYGWWLQRLVTVVLILVVMKLVYFTRY